MDGADREERGGAAAPPSAEREVMLFSVGRERFALVLEDIAEIQRATEITELPLSPPFLAGIINVHGNLASVVSLAAVLAIPDASREPLAVLLTPEKGGFAVQVDETIGFGRYAMLEEVARESPRRGGRGSFIEGVFRHGEDLYSLVSVDKLRLWIEGEFTKGED